MAESEDTEGKPGGFLHASISKMYRSFNVTATLWTRERMSEGDQGCVLTRGTYEVTTATAVFFWKDRKPYGALQK